MIAASKFPQVRDRDQYPSTDPSGQQTPVCDQGIERPLTELNPVPHGSRQTILASRFREANCA
jgi:hypothetical protein